MEKVEKGFRGKNCLNPVEIFDRRSTEGPNDGMETNDNVYPLKGLEQEVIPWSTVFILYFIQHRNLIHRLFIIYCSIASD